MTNPSASLLPNGEQQFVDGNGAPYAGGSVYFYIPNTTTPKNTWQDPDQVTLNTNPVILDAAGRAIIYGSGQYKQVLYDVNGNLIWDQLTQDTLSLIGPGLPVIGGTSGGSAQAQTLTPSPALTALTVGQQIVWTAGYTSAGLPTLNVGGLGAVNLTMNTISGRIYISVYDGTNFETTDLYTPGLTTENTLASATTTDLGTSPSNIVRVTGTTTITSLGSSASIARPLYLIRFTGILTLTYNATSLILPGAANIQTAAGDAAWMKYEGSGNWRCVDYQTASGFPVGQQPQNAIISNSLGFVNLIRNPQMAVAQRGTSGTASYNDNQYTLDGWVLNGTGANFPWQQIGSRALGTGGSSSNAVQISGAASNTGTQIAQRIESLLAVRAAGQQCTFTCHFENNSGSSMTPTLSTYFPTSTDNWGGASHDLSAVNLQTIASGSVGTLSYTFPVSSSATAGYLVQLNFAGMTSSGDNFTITACDFRVTPGIPTGLNSSPPVPELPNVALDLANCQRYYETNYGNGVTPGSSASLGIFTINGLGSVVFKVPKRVAPTVSYWDSSGNASKYSTISGTTIASTDNNPSDGLGFIGVSGYSQDIASSGTFVGVFFAASAEL